MIPLPLPPKVIQKSPREAIFTIEGLYIGYGYTLGNALRRVLLSSLEGAAVTQVKIKGVLHEFSTIPGVLEDVIMILLNIKKLRFRLYEGDLAKVELKVKGEREVKGADLKCPPTVKLANPDQHLATITNKNTELEMELFIQRGVGYVPQEQLKKGKTEIGTIIIDGLFNPVKRVSLQVENMRVGERTDFERLILGIETDGTITPQEAFFEACDILIKHYNILFEGRAEGEPRKKEKEEVLEEPEDKTKMPIEELKLSTRVINALVNNGIKTVGGLLRKSEEKLLELEGIGEKGLSEIKKEIKKLGLEINKDKE